MIDTLTEEFKIGLEELDMLPDRELDIKSGLFFINEEPEDIYKEYIKIALKKAEDYNVTAIYFRRFINKPPIPQIYIYDYTSDNKAIDAKKLGELHRKLWNSGQIPLFFIFTKTEVRIYNCFRPPEFKNELYEFITSPFETLKLASEMQEEIDKRKEFSARKFDNGIFWDNSKYKDSFNIESSVYEKLLQELKNIKNFVIKKTKKIPEKTTKKLLVMLILIKYLEEREDKEGNTVFPKSFFKQFFGAKDLIDVLRKKGAVIELFDYLSNHFNGEIFRWKDENDRNLLSSEDLSDFADFLEGKNEGQQLVIWRLYSFNDLPVELISNIYEEFLSEDKNKNGIVYTPPSLVDLLIDECMPMNNLQTDFKVLDPACGSGVFLVAAYKKIIQRWRIVNDWKTPDLNTLKKLLKDNIYGIDKEKEAVELTIFSLTIALCDELSPKVIWEELIFDKLMGENFFSKDFFEVVYKKDLGKKFDLVIGNPPFVNKLTFFAKLVEQERQKKRGKLPYKQLALLFLEQAMSFCKNNALLCMILPSSALLYSRHSYNFRKYFFENYNTIQIMDFTPLHSDLFPGVDIATLSIFVKNTKPSFDKDKILHAIFRKTKATKEKFYFDLDYYDFHYNSYREVLKSDFIWKTNLFGGLRLRHLVSKLFSMRTLGKYLKEKEKYYNWFCGEGFQTYTQKNINYEKVKKVDYLTGKKFLPTDAFTEEGIDETKIKLLEDKYFHRPRIQEIYKPPHILIKNLLGNKSIPVVYREDYLTFKERIIGIHAPEDQKDELLRLEKNIKNNKLYLFYIIAVSSETLITRATSISKEDIESLPYPENENDLNLSEFENILIEDTMDYIVNFLRKGEDAKIIREEVTKDQLDDFSSIYCSILNSIYEKFEVYKPIYTDSYICLPLYYGKKPNILEGNLDDFDHYFKKLVFKKNGVNLRIIRNFRIYDENIIYLIKPKQLRYWLRSIAIRDADETVSDLFEQGY